MTDFRTALELIATGPRPDGTWNRDREACRQLAAEALRDLCQKSPAMTDLRTAAKQALEALENSIDLKRHEFDTDWRKDLPTRAAQRAGMKAELDAHDAAIAALRAALAAAPPQVQPCIGADPLCPCQDGDACHYKDTPTTKGWPVPPQVQSLALEQIDAAIEAWFATPITTNHSQDRGHPFRGRMRAAFEAALGIDQQESSNGR
jgi:hypothetical protein